MTQHQNSVIKNSAQQLLKMFESGDMPNAVAYSIIQRKSSDVRPCINWTLSNQLLMVAQGTTDARGFKQWQSIGRMVKKGAKAIYILAPVTKMINDKETGEKCPLLVGFRPLPVFRYEDTNGNPILKGIYAPPQYPPFWQVAEVLGLEVDYRPISGNYLGKYNKINRRITLCAQDAFVYFHELAHAVHDTFEPLELGKRDTQEIIAEMSAAVLCRLQGIIGYEAQAYKYICHFIHDKEPGAILRTIMGVLNDVEKVVCKIIETAEETDRRYRDE